MVRAVRLAGFGIDGLRSHDCGKRAFCEYYKTS